MPTGKVTVTTWAAEDSDGNGSSKLTAPIRKTLIKIRKTPKEQIKMVSNTIVEEVLQDIGMLDFGEGLTCKANVATWRTHGEHRPLIGEFACQFRFQDRNKLSKDALRPAETDVRPHVLGDHPVKFKFQAVPLKEKLGGIRLLHSRNVQFFRSAVGMGKDNVTDMDALIDRFPAKCKSG